MDEGKGRIVTSMGVKDCKKGCRSGKDRCFQGGKESKEMAFLCVFFLTRFSFFFCMEFFLFCSALRGVT